ncbi:MAG: DivIVA domain-containing protein [Actinomycetota bacterium]|nr:DivIVA domain-containing protein [Actinomycetota bacterium]
MDEFEGPTTQDLLERVQRAHFSPARFEEGYDAEQVDECLARLARALEDDDPIGPVIAGAAFQLKEFREGYDTSLVDAFLLKLARDSGQEDSLPDVSTRISGRTQDRGTPPQYAARPATDEQRGLFSRMRRRKS